MWPNASHLDSSPSSPSLRTRLVKCLKNWHGILLVPPMLIAAALVGCGDDGAPPATVHPAGETADVGGWLPAETLLEGYTTLIEPSGPEQSSGWQVSVSGSDPCAPGSTSAGEQYVCVSIDIKNPTAGPGALDLAADGPKLVDQQGTRYLLGGAQIADAPDLVASATTGSISSSMECEFSAPDDAGRQQADCTMMLTATMSSQGFEEALVAVGAGKSATLNTAFLVPTDEDIWILEWPDGTGFELS